MSAPYPLPRPLDDPSSPSASASSPSVSSPSTDATRSPLSPKNTILPEGCRFIILHTRPLTTDEKTRFSTHFTKTIIMTLDPALHTEKTDLSQFDFGCLFVDFNNKLARRWYDIVKCQARYDPKTKVIAIDRKSRLCVAAQSIWDDIQPDSIVSAVPISKGTFSFLMGLLATKGPPLLSAAATVATKVAAALTN